MKIRFNGIKRIAVTLAIVATGTMCALAQNVTPDKVLATIEAMPRHQALEAFDAMLNEANNAGRKVYKNMLASYEEMLSEPTWDFHNEELFSKLIEHASTATCLNQNDRMRPELLLESVHKNAPSCIANDIEYETLEGTRNKLSAIKCDYTLIYFNDPECLSCAKVKERLDTTTILRNLVADGMLTVLGIYPYDNTEEWKLEPFPDYIINGWDFKQEIEQQQTYELMTMPLFYLLDRDKHVILKNEASLNRVIKAITKLKDIESSNIDTKLNVVFNKE